MRASDALSIAVGALLGLASCTAPAQVAPTVPVSPLAAVRFMEGAWRVDQHGTITEERWSAGSDDLMVGTSVTAREGKAVSFEFLRIESRRGGALVFVAQPRGNAPVDFPMTASGPGSATFSNPTHDFPRRIMYTRRGEELIATVDSGPDAAPDSRPQAESWAMQRVR